MKTLKAKKRAAARRCEELGISVGDRATIRSRGDYCTVTAIGMSSILVKPKKGEEIQIREPLDIVAKYEPTTVSFTLSPEQ